MTIAAHSDPIALRTALLRGKECFELFPAFSADGALLASAGWFSTPIIIWETSTQKPKQIITDDLGPEVTFSPRGDLFASAGEQAVSVWDLRTAARVARFRCDDVPFPDPQRPRPGVGEGDGPISEHRRLAFDAQQAHLILLTDEFLRGWDLKSLREEFFYRLGPEESGSELLVHEGRVLALTAYCPDQTGTNASSPLYLSALDLAAGIRTFIAPRLPGKILFTPNRRWAFFAVAGEGPPDPELWAILKAHGGEEYLCLAHHVKRYEVWDVAAGQRCGVLTLDDRLLEGRLLAAGGRYLALAAVGTPAVEIWDVRRAVPMRRIDVEGGQPCSLSPTHQLLAVLMYQPEELVGQTIFYNPLTGEALGRAYHYATPLVFSPCGRWCASALSDNTHLWRTWPEPNGTVYLTDLAPILSLAQRWDESAE